MPDSRLAVFARPPLIDVNDSIGFGLHPQWDSVAQISIVMSIEEAYGITVPDESIASLTSISGIAAYVSTFGAP